MNKPREFYVVYTHGCVEACKSRLDMAISWKRVWSCNDAEIIKVREVIDAKTTENKATKPKRVKAASSVKKVVRKGKAKTKKAGKKKGVK
jgi:hypothetical protein